MQHHFACLAVCLGFIAANSAHAVTNLLTNPGFLNTDGTTNPNEFGDGWGKFGAADFNAFFGAGNPHASLFGDDAFNIGGVFQQGILGTPGTTYQFDIMNTRIESAWDADLKYGIEFYAADDITLLGDSFVMADTATRLALPNVDSGGAVNGAVFSMQGTGPAGTVFARPVVKFDNVNPDYVAGSTPQANSFVFNSFLAEVPAPGGELLKNPGFEDEDGQGDLGDFWGSFDNAGFNDFFSGGGAPNGHASFFADQPGHSGGIFQQSVLGTAGTQYEFVLSDVRIEANFDANLRFGLEYYGDDDFNKLGETVEVIAADTGQVDNNVFVMSGTAPTGTIYVRPVVLFDDSRVADFDSDLDVDGRDFLTWQRGLGTGTTLAAGDANNDSSVAGDDLAAWENQFGVTDASAQKNLAIFDASLVELVPSIRSVPEPSSAIFLLSGLLGLTQPDRRRSRA